MITLRPAQARGHFDFGWLDTRHTFSFGEYMDPKQMGFRHLRVLNEDRVKPGQGFGTHGHRDMEIITYVISGALEHKDSTGAVGVLKNGWVQRMSAGTGVRHSEYNASMSEAVHFLQIWIIPAKLGISPRYDDRYFAPETRQNRLALLAAPEEDESGAVIHATGNAPSPLSLAQNAHIYATVLDPGSQVELPLAKGHAAWVQIARGSLTLEATPSPSSLSNPDASTQVLKAGDGASIENTQGLRLTAIEACEALVFDLG